MYRDPALAGDWAILVDRLTRRCSLVRWGAREPELDGVGSVAELEALLRRGADPDRADRVVGALVRLSANAGAGDDDALLLLLHLLSDGVLALSRQLQDLSPDAATTVVTELACQIRAYPVTRRTRAFAANLLADTRRAVLAEFRPWVRRPGGVAVQLLAPYSPAWEATRLGRAVPGPGEDEDLDVADLLCWAVRWGVDRDGLALLVAIERGRAEDPSCSQDLRVAAEQGVGLRTLYRRRARTLTALRAAARDYLSAVA